MTPPKPPSCPSPPPVSGGARGRVPGAVARRSVALGLLGPWASLASGSPCPGPGPLGSGVVPRGGLGPFGPCGPSLPPAACGERGARGHGRAKTAAQGPAPRTRPPGRQAPSTGAAEPGPPGTPAAGRHPSGAAGRREGGGGRGLSLWRAPESAVKGFPLVMEV